MNKRDALALANGQYGTSFTASNTHFSKVNKTKPVWWLEIPIHKINSGTLTFINLLLEEKQSLRWLKVDTVFLRKNLKGFKIREDKGVICLEIDVDTFQNTVGSEKLNFGHFIQTN